MGLRSDVLDGQLGKKRALVVVEDELSLGYDVDEVGADVKTRAEEMRMSLEVLVTTAIVVTFAL